MISSEKMMISKLFVFRHAETFDNHLGIFSGWRDSELTSEGLMQAYKIGEQLKRYQIDYAFTSHLKRAQKTLEIVLQAHPDVPVFVDDRLIERCYGLLQGKSKRKLEEADPEWYAQFHRGYGSAPPKGESLRMVEKRVISFLQQLEKWLEKAPGNVAISCHNNSIRPIRMVFENLSLKQMLQLETPQDCAITYELQLHNLSGGRLVGESNMQNWESLLVSRQVKLSTDPLNPLKKYYDL